MWQRLLHSSLLAMGRRPEKEHKIEGERIHGGAEQVGTGEAVNARCGLSP